MKHSYLAARIIHSTLIYVHVCHTIFRGSFSQTTSIFSDVDGEPGGDWIGFVDPNEPRYCLCNQVTPMPNFALCQSLKRCLSLLETK